MEEKTPSSNNQLYYVLGAVAIAAVAGAVFFLRQQTPVAEVTPEPTVTGTQTGGQQQVAAPTSLPTGPITKLACEQQYYNPVIGFPKYFLSTEGVDITDTTTVDCDYTVTVAGKVVAQETASAQLIEVPERGGLKFKCSTSALELTKNVATKIQVTLRDDKGETATCNKTFLLP